MSALEPMLPVDQPSGRAAEFYRMELEYAGLLMNATKQLMEVFDLLQLDANERGLLQGAAMNYGEALSGIRRLEWVKAMGSSGQALANSKQPTKRQKR